VYLMSCCERRRGRVAVVAARTLQPGVCVWGAQHHHGWTSIPCGARQCGQRIITTAIVWTQAGVLPGAQRQGLTALSGCCLLPSCRGAGVSPVRCYSQQWSGAGQAVGHASAGAGVTARCTAECRFWAPHSAGDSAHAGAPPGSHARWCAPENVDRAGGTKDNVSVLFHRVGASSC